MNYHIPSRNSSVEVKSVEADAKLFNRMFLIMLLYEQFN